MQQVTLSDQDQTITLSGVVDHSNVMAILQQGCQFIKQHQNVRVDLAKVQRFGTVDLALLVQWWRYAQQHQYSLSFDLVSDDMLKMAEIHGIKKVLFDKD
jgi:ABC-type transporter Mla MlaB component